MTVRETFSKIAAYFVTIAVFTMAPIFRLLILVALLVDIGCCFTTQLPRSSRKHVLTSGPVASQSSPILSRPSLISSSRLGSTAAAVIGDFKFQGHKIYSEVYAGSNKNLDVILIHGYVDKIISRLATCAWAEIPLDSSN